MRITIVDASDSATPSSAAATAADRGWLDLARKAATDGAVHMWRLDTPLVDEDGERELLSRIEYLTGDDLRARGGWEDVLQELELGAAKTQRARSRTPQ